HRFCSSLCEISNEWRLQTDGLEASNGWFGGFKRGLFTDQKIIKSRTKDYRRKYRYKISPALHSAGLFANFKLT
ncbi:MAG: hypothetical protein K2O54_05550, partial [Prevotella sp.]|nr:hypothetical protein [Prevotella sp.]